MSALKAFNFTMHASSSSVVMMTPEKARQLRQDAHFPRQRNITKYHVQFLSEQITKHKFIPALQVYICCLPDGTEFIVNGNHTLEAVCESGVTLPVTVTRHNVQDVDEAGTIYAVFDQQKRRTWADSIRAVGGADMPDKGKIVSAVNFIDHKFNCAGDDFRKHVRDRNSIIALMHEEYACAARSLFDCIAGGDQGVRKLIERRGVLSVALVTTKYQPTAAEEFWKNLAFDNGLCDGMPEKALLRWLRNNRPGNESTGYTAKASALAWNAHWRGEQRQVIKAQAMTTFYLLGTPYESGLKDA